MKRRSLLYGVVALTAFVAAAYSTGFLERGLLGLYQRARGKKTVADRVAQYGAAVRARILPDFQRQGVPYPPKRVTLLGLKRENVLEVWAPDGEGAMKRVRTYPIRAKSGGIGPKLREGDRQVPEGIYGIESINPNSMFHLSLRVNYPNEFDQARAAEDKRSTLGGDIFIHGKASSVGCLAMGDEAAEDLFVLAAETGVENVRVILAPCDLRREQLAGAAFDGLPGWYPELCARIARELETLADTTN